MNRWILSLLCGMAGLCLGCTAPPSDAMRVSDTLMKDRSLQCRTYESDDEQRILAASAGVLQDLGFLLEESDRELGLVVGSKTRSAAVARQQVGSFLLACVGIGPLPTDSEQTFWASVTTHPRGEHQLVVRVTFQRVIWDSMKNITKKEPLVEPEFYREFFNRLSQAVFLEEHQI